MAVWWLCEVTVDTKMTVTPIGSSALGPVECAIWRKNHAKPCCNESFPFCWQGRSFAVITGDGQYSKAQPQPQPHPHLPHPTPSLVVANHTLTQPCAEPSPPQPIISRLTLPTFPTMPLSSISLHATLILFPPTLTSVWLGEAKHSNQTNNGKAYMGNHIP